MTARTRLIFLSLAIFCFLADQTSKYGVFRWMYNDGRPDRKEVVPGWFCLITHFDEAGIQGDCICTTWSGPILPTVNKGALFGIGGTMKDRSNMFFAFVSGVASLAILWWGLKRTPRKDGLLILALGFILGGTVGNFYDRVVFGGVRDFLYFYRVEWPVFNVADCCLVVGAFALMIQAFFMEPAPAQPAATEETAQPAIIPAQPLQTDAKLNGV
jgi:signal peptidase II